MKTLLLLLLCLYTSLANAHVKLGIDVLFENGYHQTLLKGKRIGLISNVTAINGSLKSTFEVLKEKQGPYELILLLAPEHGFYGNAYAYESIEDTLHDEIPLYGLHGKRSRPTPEMLSKIDVLVYDVQDIGSRSYTFVSTLFYCMEEAAKGGKEVVVLDRPNPMGGLVVDGPPMDEAFRSFLGYVNVPYCHGMTIGEIATFFNEEYHIGCKLTVIPMKGWKRGMSFQDTKLFWVPTSPQIPESDTPFFYSTTGLIGHCSIANIGIGYTLPFKLIGAPWIDADKFADNLNQQNLPGVYFQPFYFKPFFGKFKLESCKGVRILVTDPKIYLPVTTQYTIMGVIKNLYPKQFKESVQKMSESKSKREAFNKLNGNEEVLRILLEEPYVIWKLRELCESARKNFMPIRKKYLIPQYG